MKIFKIKVIKSATDKCWYVDKIGKEFIVMEYDDEHFALETEKSEYERHLFFKTDCEIIK